MNNLIMVILLMNWMIGIVLAKGFWLTTLACIMPFYAWYLTTEWAMHMVGWLPRVC